MIGSPGAGKSTFARKLRDMTGLPLYYLDMLWHKPDRTNISREAFDLQVKEIVKKDRWIIDGNYQRTLPLRLKECDTVFLLDYPLELCLAGAKSRIGTKREDMPWTETEFDEEFKQWIVDFPKEQLPKIYELLENCQENKKVYIFKSREEADAYLAESFLDHLTEQFVEQSRGILGDNLVGIYLHGSAAMGCFHADKSDVDLLVVVDTVIPDRIKRQYMDMVVELNAYAPKKGIELSVVRRDVCNPFIYPTPFELHFSIAHLEWYKRDPLDYVERMKGVDKDLAAHITVTCHRGKCLWGEGIKDVFGEVSREFYFDSIWNDIKNGEEEILTNPTYIILNLCRVLAYKREGLILSKQEGGSWGIENVPVKYHPLILHAFEEYASNKSTEWDGKGAREYAAYMIAQISK